MKRTRISRADERHQEIMKAYNKVLEDIRRISRDATDPEYADLCTGVSRSYIYNKVADMTKYSTSHVKSVITKNLFRKHNIRW